MRRFILFFAICSMALSCYALKNPYTTGAKFTFYCTQTVNDSYRYKLTRNYWYWDWYVTDYDPETGISVIEQYKRRYHTTVNGDGTWMAENYGWYDQTYLRTDTIIKVDDVFLRKNEDSWSYFYCFPGMKDGGSFYLGSSWPSKVFFYASSSGDTFQYNYGGQVYNITLSDLKASYKSYTWTDLGLSEYSDLDYQGSDGGSVKYELKAAYIPDNADYPDAVYGPGLPTVDLAYGIYYPAVELGYTNQYGYHHYIGKGCVGIYYNLVNSSKNPNVYAINLVEGYVVPLNSDDFANSTLDSFYPNTSLSYSAMKMSYDISKYSNDNFTNLLRIWYNNEPKNSDDKAPYSLKDAWGGYHWLFVFAPFNEYYNMNGWINQIWSWIYNNYYSPTYWDELQESIVDPLFPAIYTYIGDNTKEDTYDLNYKATISEDVNQDGMVNSLDVLKIYKFMQTSTGDESGVIEDVNQDNKVNSLDVLKVYKYMQTH